MKITIAVLLLALGGWVGFYLMGAPLNPSETGVLVGLAGVLVWSARWLYRLLRNRDVDDET